jgi:DNA repair ATPase RecN
MDKKTSELVGQQKGCLADLAEAEARMELAVTEHTQAEKSEALVETVAAEINKKVAQPLVKTTQAMVDSVFPGEYIVKMDFGTKNHRTHVDIYLEDYDGTKIYPLDDDGGGVANMMELGLRFSALQLSGQRKTIVLDQPLKDLSDEYLPLAGKILRKLSKELGIQLIIINHLKPLMPFADRTFSMKKNLATGRTEVKVTDNPAIEDEFQYTNKPKKQEVV